MDEVPLYPRRGQYPFQPPQTPGDRPLKVAIVYEVCFRFRVPIFRRLTDHPSLNVRLFLGSDVPGTKFINAPDLSGLDARILWTLKKLVNSSGRRVPLLFNPTLLFHLARFRPDVLLLSGGMLPNNLLCLLYAKATGTPIVWWSLGEVAQRDFKGLSGLYRRLTQWIERQATCYAGYSSMAIDYFLRQGYSAERCFNLVNVVDTELVQQRIESCRPKLERLRHDLKLDGKRVVLFVGSLTQTKGVDALVKAHARLGGERRQTRLLIVGDGPERPAVEALVDELGLRQEVVFTGAVYDGVEAYFQLGDLLVLPGTGGLAISEAMTHRLPVICSIGDGVEVDLIETGQNGYRVGPNNVEQLAARMSQMLASPKRLQAMGEHSRQIIDRRANIDRYMHEMLSAIHFAADKLLPRPQEGGDAAFHFAKRLLTLFSRSEKRLATGRASRLGDDRRRRFDSESGRTTPRRPRSAFLDQ